MTLPQGTQPAQTASGTVLTGVGWGGQLFPYLNNAALYQCPFDKTVAMKPASVVSYAYNTNTSGTSQSVFASPSLTVLLFEVGGDTADVHYSDEGAFMGATLFSGASDGTDGNLVAGLNSAVAPSVYYATGFMGRLTLSSGSQFTGSVPRDDPYQTNVLYDDGHVKNTIPGQISTGTDAPDYNSPQTGTVHGTAAGTFNIDSYNFAATFSVR